jgi:hypothetical protein
MISIEEFRDKVRILDTQEILETFFLCDGARHVSSENIDRIKNVLASKYGVSAQGVRVLITGSAKLGFSISEKMLKDGTVLERYRPFRADSDIDVAVINSGIFDAIWNELSMHAHNRPRLPWNSGHLGDYLVCGWIRPDKFPRYARLRRCDDWWSCFNSFSADSRFGRRKVRGGLFYSVNHLIQYLGRSVNECRLSEDLKNENSAN